MESPLTKELRKSGEELTAFLTMEIAVTGAVLFTLLAVGALLLTVRPVLLPPGPRLWPLLGNLNMLIRQDARELVAKLRDEYGDIFSLYFGRRPVVVIAGLRLIKEAFIKNADIFSERPKGLAYERFTSGKGIMNTSGKPWKQQRKFAMTALRDLGMGTEAMEIKVGPEMIQLTSHLLDLGGEPFDPHDVMLVTVSNVVFNVCFGKRFQRGDPEFDIFAKSLNDIFSNVGMDSLLHFLPFLGWLPGDPFKFNKLSETNVTLSDFTLRHLKSRLEQISEEPECFADLYMRKMQMEAQTEKHSDFDAENLTEILLELVTAGSETTASTLQWMLLYLALNREAQDTAQTEIDQVLEGSFPTYSDRSRLPYTEAVILETQRLADVTPFAMMHAVTKDTMLAGFQIPQHAIVIPSVTSVMMDPKLFPEPDQFKPDRFLGVQRDRLREFGLIPFFVGKRICLGESLARMELFLLTVAMLQHFRFVLPEDTLTPCLKGTLGATRRPHPFKIRALRRERN